MRMKPDSSPPILCLGLNLAVDRVVEAPGLDWGRHVVGRTLLDQPAGKAVNVARSLARLGRANLHVLGLVGDDEEARFARTLASSDIAWHGVTFTGATRHHLTLIDPATQRDMHWRESGTSIAPSTWQRLAERFSDLVKRLSPIVVITGSLPPGVSVSSVLGLIRMVQAADLPLVLDMSGQTLAELHRSLADWHPWLVKPNQQEMEDWLGQPWPQRLNADTLRRWLEPVSGWAQNMVISLGSQGALALQKGRIWHVQTTLPPQQRIADTVGCGDAMVAGLIESLGRNPDISAALTRAGAVAAANALAIGAANFDLNQVSVLEKTTQLDGGSPGASSCDSDKE